MSYMYGPLTFEVIHFTFFLKYYVNALYFRCQVAFHLRKLQHLRKNANFSYFQKYAYFFEMHSVLEPLLNCKVDQEIHLKSASFFV
jgi:hypothetical protein